MNLPIFSILGALLLTGILYSDEEQDNHRRIHLYLEGRSVFQENCSQCHGRLGKGDGEWAEGWTVSRPRNFRTGVFKFRTTPMGKLPTDDDLRRTISVGISGTAMPAFKNHLRDSEFEAVIEYLKHLSRRWKEPENFSKPTETPPVPSWVKMTPSGASSVDRHITHGKSLFTQHCLTCHGEQGKGNGVAGVALMDVWGHKILPADLSKKHLKSGANKEDLFRTVAMGLDGTPMVGFKPILKDEQIWELVAYLYTLKEKS